MPKLVILESAAADLGEIQDYIAADNPTRAVSFRRELVQHCKKLAGLPGTHGRARPELRTDLRSVVYRGYVILFRYTRDRFEVLNIIEGHRDIDALFFEEQVKG
jgi:toxin ParE1/3/4